MKKSLLILIFIIATIYHQANAQSSPVAHWRLDESSGTVASDNSGNNQNGALNGCSWRSAGGKKNGALFFNGTTDFVNCNTNPGSSPALSVAFWMNTSSLKHQIPVDKLPAAGSSGWSVKVRNNGEVWIRVGSEASHDDMILYNAYKANTWVHIAFTFQNGMLATYIDGTIAGTKTNITQTVNNTSAPFRLGVSASNGGEAFGGMLDDVMVYNRVLSYDEIMLMNGITPPVSPTGGDLTMWYNTEAGVEFTNALPIGNGRMGGMVYGNVAQDKIGLNEATVWSGSPGSNNKAGASAFLADARARVFAGDYFGADNVVKNNMIGSGNQAFQPVGNLNLNFAGHTPTNYYRELDLKTAVAKTTYTYNGVKYTREYFASYPDQAIIIRLTADQPGKITYTTTMDTPHTPGGVTVSGSDVLILNGEADAIRFQSRAKVKIDGGSLTSNGSAITVTNANSSTIILTIGTNFNSYNDVSGDQSARATQYLNTVDPKSYAQIRQDHINSYQQLFNRVDFNPGPANAYSSYPTNQRIATFNFSNDPQLVRLYYQFGRYLLISCSRPGSQAANLQGVWNNLMSPPWGSNYTTNINTEMNYWMAETANLPECAEPLIDKVKNMVPQGRLTAQAHWGVTTGWVSHHQTDLWNHTAPMDGPWGFWPTGGAWLSKHLWEHYQFNPDRSYLTDVYPTIKGAAEFFLSSLVTETVSGNNYLVTCPSASPENSHNGGANVSFAPTMDTQIIRDVFNSTIRASEILNVDATLRAQITTAVSKLPPNKIGKFGQLQEWFYDWDNPNDNHRHVSHLYGAFPGNQITKRGTPALSDAVKTTLIQRGDLSTGWSLAWKINLWARQEDGNHAYDLIRMLLTPERTYNNLFDAHPPFQIDGNFGAVSGIDEMLLQSQNNEIQFLPALPSAWATGSINGLRARGGFAIDSIKWQNGQLVKTVITSILGGICNVRYGNIVKQFNTEPNKKYILDGSLTVTNQNPTLPVITSSGTASGTMNSVFNYAITASNSPTSFGATGLPGGLSVNTNTGVISGTPTTAGTYNATVTATNSSGTGSKPIIITINPPQTAPVITSGGTATGVLNAFFNYTITASGSATSYGASGLPAGLSVNTSTGVISGMPTATGTFNSTVTATNSSGTGSKAVTITITTPPPCTAPYINLTSTAPTIDTSIDAIWSDATVGSINNVTLGARPADFTGSQWRALYDNTNLYVLVEVKDANRFSDSGTSWWEDDVVEIFIDGNNSKGTSYDGVNDFQYGFRYNDAAIKIGGSSVNRTTGVTFIQHNVTNGYNIEVRIPWSTIGVTPISGNKIGFDVSVDDDDNGGVRDAQMTAFATTGIGYTNPSVFGSVTLCSGTATPSPVVSNASLPTGTVNSSYSTTITASNSPASFGATGLPAGLSVNTSSGVISGTPTASGTFTVTLSATNASGTGTKQLSLVVNPAGAAPVVSNTSLPTGTVGTTYNTTITASNNPTSFNATSLPAGLSVNTSTGVISGTPTASGTVTVTLSATNASGTGTKQLSLVVNPAGAAPVVSNTSLPTGTVGTAYNTTITATNNPTSRNATGLPAGLSVNTSTGVISGTPTASGTFTVTLSATNASGTGTKQLSLVVNPAGAAPVVSNTSLPTGTVGTAYNTTITATNNPTSRNATGLPAGLSVNTSTGVISGTPTASGTFTVTLSATNASGTGTKQLSLVVNPAGDPPGVVTCLRTSGTITVNGTLAETNWNSVITKSISKSISGSPNNTATFGVLWDNTNLYVGVRVLDANLHSDSPNTWDDDAVEVYIDANNNKLTTYDGRDNQIIKNYNKSTVFTKLAVTGLQHGWAAITGGYSIELAIPWSQLGVAAPAAGQNYGFDVGYDDDDNAGARDHQAVWNGTVNNYQNTSAFGTLTLSGSISAKIASQNTIAASGNDSGKVVYWPNPVDHEVNIIMDGSYHTLEIVDVLGKSFYHDGSILGKTNIEVDMSGTAGGIHLIRLSGEYKNELIRIMKR